jgi:hypothetical protein
LEFSISRASTGSINRTFNDGDSECDDVWQQHLEELGDVFFLEKKLIFTGLIL